MEEFIQQVVSKFGISEGQAEEATGGVLGFIKKQVPTGDFQELLSKIPGAEALNDRTPDFSDDDAGEEESGGGGGLLGGALSAASGLIGGKTGSALGALSALSKTGISLDKTDDFLGMLGTFLKSKAGEGLVQKIAEHVPALKGLLG